MLRLNMTEKLFTGTLNKNQNKTKQTFFLIFSLKHRLWVLVRTGLSVPTIYVLSKNKKNINIFQQKIVIFAAEKITVYYMGMFS